MSKHSKIKTVKRSELSTVRMVAGNEKKYSMVILNDGLQEWVGIGWIYIRLATDDDKKDYPIVEE